MKDKVSDFLKFAKEKGKIKDVKEAFEEYPVEEVDIDKIEEYKKSFYDNNK